MVAALLHAGWNALVKTSADKQTGMLFVTLVHAFIGLCLIPFLPIPNGKVWLWLLASGFIHMANHALIKGGLFMAVTSMGYYLQRRITIHSLSGLGKTMPITFFCFVLA